jgi:hypothetical protein
MTHILPGETLMWCRYKHFSSQTKEAAQFGPQQESIISATKKALPKQRPFHIPISEAA